MTFQDLPLGSKFRAGGSACWIKMPLLTNGDEYHVNAFVIGCLADMNFIHQGMVYHVHDGQTMFFDKDSRVRPINE